MKVAIYGGGGGVGASLAFNLMTSGERHEIVLIDSRPQMVASHALDLEQVRGLGAPSTIRGGDGGDIGNADVAVLTASTPFRVNGSRMEFLEENAAIVREFAATIDRDWGGVVLLVTNPVDPLVRLLLEQTGLPRERVIGYTLNDTLRLRAGIARATGRALETVTAWVIGEHGDHCVPLFSRVEIDGARVELDAAQRAQALDYLRGWYRRHVALDSGRSSTWTSGLGTARMVGAIVSGPEQLFPASVMLTGEYEVDGVSLGVPVTLGAGGVRAIHEWELASDERTAFLKAAADGAALLF
jgi:malate dehydrogenase